MNCQMWGWHKQTQARFRCFLLHTCDVLHVARWLCNIVVCGRLDWFERCRYEYNESDLYRFLLYCFIASDLRLQHRRCKSGNFSMRLETLILCFWGRSKRRQSYTERLQVPKGTIFNWQTWFSCVVFMTIVFTHQNRQTLCFNDLQRVESDVFRCFFRRFCKVCTAYSVPWRWNSESVVSANSSVNSNGWDWKLCCKCGAPFG